VTYEVKVVCEDSGSRGINVVYEMQLRAPVVFHEPTMRGDVHMTLLSGLNPIPLLQPTSSLMVVTVPSGSYLA
jgi:hypothetical protein